VPWAAPSGQVPEYTETDYVLGERKRLGPPFSLAHAEYFRYSRRCARGQTRGADGLSAINTINSITGIDLDTFIRGPTWTGNRPSRRLLWAGGKAIALNMAQKVQGDPESSTSR